MNICDAEIPIRLIGGPKHASLKLEGTVLTFSCKQAGVETRRYIPVELISISTDRARDGKILIKALMWLLAAVLAGPVIGVTTGAFESEDSLTSDICVVIMIFIWLAGLVLFIISFVRFLKRRTTVGLELQNEGYLLVFWKNGKKNTIIEDLLESIKERQGLINEEGFQVLEHSLTLSFEKSLFWKFLALTFIFSIPALCAEDARLFALLIIPLAWYLYNIALFHSCPHEYRSAWRAYTRGDQEKALAELDKLNVAFLKSAPTIGMEIHIHLRNDDFDKALQAAEKFSEEDFECKRAAQDVILYAQRLYKRRFNSIAGDGDIDNDYREEVN